LVLIENGYGFGAHDSRGLQKIARRTQEFEKC
jgi:hypothetical protein